MTDEPIIHAPPVDAEKVEVLVNRFADVFRSHCTASGRTPQSIREALNAMACVAGLAITAAPPQLGDCLEYFVWATRNQISRALAEKLARAQQSQPPKGKP